MAALVSRAGCPSLYIHGVPAILTAIEQSYLDQGHVLPEPLTWGQVAERRARWRIDPIFVPLALAPGCLAWGVPFVDGKPLEHP